MTQSEFAQQLEIQRLKLMKTVEETFYFMEAEELNVKPDKNSWSILQCFDHINRANGTYLKAFEKRLDRYSGPSHATDKYRMGVMGKFMTRSMTPKEGKIRWKMKTFQKLKPLNEQYPEARLMEQVVFEDFQGDMERLRVVLEKSPDLPWHDQRISSALGSMVKFKFGDAMAFVLAHTQRHIQQATNVKDTFI